MTKTTYQKENAELMKAHRTNMRAFYRKRPKMVDFILNFFDMKEGIRCRSILSPIPKSNGRQSYIRYDINNKKGNSLPIMETINKDNVMHELTHAKTMFFHAAIFSDDVNERTLDKNGKDDLNKQIIGITPVMDVDSHYIYPIEKYPDTRSKRIDSLSLSGIHVLEKFEQIRLIAKSELTDVGLWNDTRMMFSGNGVYFLLPTIYGTLNEIYDYGYAADALINDINHDIGETMIDSFKVNWSNFFKIPFSFHNDYHPRMSIPLNKNKLVVYEVSKKDW